MRLNTRNECIVHITYMTYFKNSVTDGGPEITKDHSKVLLSTSNDVTHLDCNCVHVKVLYTCRFSFSLFWESFVFTLQLFVLACRHKGECYKVGEEWMHKCAKYRCSRVGDVVRTEMIEPREYEQSCISVK